MLHEDDALDRSRVQAWSHVAPPPALDALVRERFQRVLEEERQARQEPERAPAPQYVPQHERWVYAFGLVAYGAQFADGLARLLWHAFAG